MPTSFSSLFKKMLLPIVWNAALRSSNTNSEIQPRSDDKSKSFVTPIRAVSVLWYGLNPDWKSSQIPFLSKKEHSCEDTAFSSNFDRKDTIRIYQILDTWLSNERLVSKSTPRFITDDEDLKEQPQYSRLLREEVFCPIIRNSVFQNLEVGNYKSSNFLYPLCIPLILWIDKFR